jgi:hypothetical protein
VGEAQPGEEGRPLFPRLNGWNLDDLGPYCAIAKHTATLRMVGSHGASNR